MHKNHPMRKILPTPYAILITEQKNHEPETENGGNNYENDICTGSKAAA